MTYVIKPRQGTSILMPCMGISGRGLGRAVKVGGTTATDVIVSKIQDHVTLNRPSTGSDYITGVR